MTYDEMMAAYLAAGGSLGSRNADAEMSFQQAMMAAQGALVQMPDGRFARVMPDGSIVAADRSADGGTQNMSLWSPGAQEAVNQSIPYNDDNWQRSLAGALAVGIGGPALGIMGNAIQASLAPAVAPVATAAPTAAGGGAAGAGGLSMQELLASNYALSGDTALSGFGAGVEFGGPTSLELARNSMLAAGGIDPASFATTTAPQTSRTGVPTPPGTNGPQGAGWMSDLAKLGIPAAGALVGALGSGDKTTTTQTLMDPAARAYLDSFRARAEQVATPPYVAPDFALTQGPTSQQVAGADALQALINSSLRGQYQGTASDFSSGVRDIGSAANAQLDRALGLIGSGTASGTSAQNAEMGRVRSLLDAGSVAGEAARNAYYGQNPFVDPMIQAAQGDLSRAYANTVAPKFASGSSFGNSGLGFAEVDSRNDLMRNLGRIASDIRFADYNFQGDLGEKYATRADNMFISNRNREIQGASILGNLGESSATRADNMLISNRNREIQGANIVGNLGEAAALRADNIAAGNANRTLQGVQLGMQGLRDQSADARSVFDAGTTMWNQGQTNINNQWTDYLNRQNYARDQLSAMNPALGVAMNTGQSQTIPGNPWAGAAGGAITGAQIARWLNS